MAHIPVMMTDVLEALQPTENETYIDATFGGGGYTSAILDAAACRVIALDRDAEAIARGQDMAARYGDRLRLVQTDFAAMDAVVPEKVDGVVLDIGVSSFQIDEAARGFSFMKDGPLDMRMDPSTGRSAADVVNMTMEQELADIIYTYGEERQSRKIAKAIVMDREKEPFTTTKQLADMIERIIPRGKDKVHPATRTFQALRIAVNDELGQLERGLEAAERILNEGGRLVVVTFHSLEDGIVKQFFKSRTGGDTGGGSRHMPMPVRAANDAPITFTQTVKKAIKVNPKEAQDNPRARSAKLRWAVRTAEGVQ